MVGVLKSCQREISKFPEEVRGDVADAVARLAEGHLLIMPFSRSMPSIGKGVHELRFKDRAGIYRVIYVLVGGGVVWLLHAFQKKTEKTTQINLNIARNRLRQIK